MSKVTSLPPSFLVSSGSSDPLGTYTRFLYPDGNLPSGVRVSGSGKPFIICAKEDNHFNVIYDFFSYGSNFRKYLDIDFYFNGKDWTLLDYHTKQLTNSYSNNYFLNYAYPELFLPVSSNRSPLPCFYNSEVGNSNSLLPYPYLYFKPWSGYDFPSFSLLFPAVFIAVMFFIFIYKMFKRVLF